MKRKTKKYLLQGIIFSCLGLVCLISYATIQSLKVAENKQMENLEYVSYEILTDNIMPVSKETTEQNDLVRPYEDETVEIGKTFYDYQAEEQNQQDSIIYYENTYIQNTGVDYVSKEIFQVRAIKEGTVASITKDDITGTTIKIKHENNMISIYQSVDKVTVKENDQVTKGEQIAVSGTNNINSSLGNHLHFELYSNNVLVDPEKYFTNSEGN